MLVAGHVMLACPPGQQDDVIPPLMRAILPWTLSHYHALRCSLARNIGILLHFVRDILNRSVWPQRVCQSAAAHLTGISLR